MKKLIIISFCALLLAMMLPTYAANDPEDEMLDEIIVKFFDRSQFPGREKQYDDEVQKILKDGLSVVTNNVYVVKADGLKRNPNAFLNRFKNSKFIEYVEPNYIVKLSREPNDPNYTTLKTLLSTINAQVGWDIITGGDPIKGDGPIVAVIDSGVVQHPDLPKLLPGYAAVSNLSPNNDKLNHGSGVAGTIGALGNNKLGTVGINWYAKILPVKVDDASGIISVANIAKGIIWAADNGAKVINLSLGGASESVTEKNAIDYAYGKGAAIFAASGNESKSSLNFPARYSNVMAVGSTGNGTTRIATSNYGTGMGVVAASSYYTTTASNGYVGMSGTSFATPQVSGLASLILTLNPALKNEEVYSFIQQGAKPLGGGYNTQTGYGIIDIGKTLTLVRNKMPAPKVDTTPPVLKLLGSLAMDIKQGEPFIEPGYTAIDDTDGDITGKVTVEGTVNISIPDVYRLTYRVSDAAGNTAMATRVVEVIYVDDIPPALTLIGGEFIQVDQGRVFVDPGYKAIDNVDGDITDKVVVSGRVNVDVPNEYMLEYRVSDTAGNVSMATRVVEVIVFPVGEPEPYHPADDKPTDLRSFLLEAATGGKNDYNGSLGYEFEVLEDMVVSYVGRPLNESMRFSHEVYIWDANTMSLLGSGTVRPDSPLDALGFKVAQLSSDIVLYAGGLYRIVSAEIAGGDRWYDVEQPKGLMPVSVSRITAAVFTDAGAHFSYPHNTLDAVGIRGPVGATFYYRTKPPVIPPVEKPVYFAPPAITLRGSLETTILVDEEYVESGFEALDCFGVDLSGAVRVTHNINIWTPGIYTVNYYVEDAGGNSARATRTVFVVEMEEEPRPVNAPILVIIGSDPIILHLTSDTPYIEQGAYAICDVDGELSENVLISGYVDRNTAGTYVVSYRVVNSAGLEATATRTVEILAPDEIMPPRIAYNFNGSGKVPSLTTHRNIVVEHEGWMNFNVTNIDKNVTIAVVVKDQRTGATVFSNSYNSLGGTQFWADEGVYNVDVTIAAGNGSIKYGIRLITPEALYYVFYEGEVPLWGFDFDPGSNWLRTSFNRIGRFFTGFAKR